MQKSGAGLHTANSCYWDTATDGERGIGANTKTILFTIIQLDLVSEKCFFHFVREVRILSALVKSDITELYSVFQLLNMNHNDNFNC